MWFIGHFLFQIEHFFPQIERIWSFLLYSWERIYITTTLPKGPDPPPPPGSGLLHVCVTTTTRVKFFLQLQNWRKMCSKLDINLVESAVAWIPHPNSGATSSHRSVKMIQDAFRGQIGHTSIESLLICELDQYLTLNFLYRHLLFLYFILFYFVGFLFITLFILILF